jgi:hypothetical protein
MVGAGAATMTTAELAAVRHTRLAAAVTTAQKPGQQQLTAAPGFLHSGAAFVDRNADDYPLAPLELFPADVGL